MSSAMDAQALRMQIEMYGGERRDKLSTAEMGRERDTTRQERIAKYEAEEHRKKAQSGPEDNERANMLRAWNTPDTFGGGDAISASLANRCDGQGHRGRLHETVSHIDHDFDDHERGPRPNYRHDGGGANQRGRDAIPRNANIANLAAAPVRDPNRPRAASPRAAGRVRIINGVRHAAGGSKSAPPLPPGLQAQQAQAQQALNSPRPAAAARPSAVPRPAIPPQGQQQGQPTARPSMPPQVQPAPRPVAAPAVIASPRPVDAPLTPRTRATAPATTTAPAPPSSAPQSATQILEQNQKAIRYKLLAQVYAAQPTAQSEEYYMKNPDQVKYLESARHSLAAEAVRFAGDATGTEAQQYYELHQDRRWILQAAVAALSGVDITDDKIKKPMALEVIKAARAAMEKKREASATAGNSTPASTQQTQPSATPVTTGTTVAPSLAEQVRQQADLAEQSRPTTPQIVVTADDNALRSSSSDATRAPASVPSAQGGRLNVVYHDATGNIIGTEPYNIGAPVLATMTIHPMQGHYDPRQLATAMQALAQQMHNRTMGNFRRGNDGLWEEGNAQQH